MSLKIWTTATSITIADNNENRVTVLKTKTGVEFHSSLATSGVNKDLLTLQETIKYRLLNPDKDRDSYKVRFNNIAKLVKESNVDSFHKLNTLIPA